MGEKLKKALRSTAGFFTGWAATIASLVITFFGIYPDLTARKVACAFVIGMFFLSLFRHQGIAEDRNKLAKAEGTLRKIGTWEQQFQVASNSYASDKLEAANLKQLWLDAEDVAHQKSFSHHFSTSAAAAKTKWMSAEEDCKATRDKLVRLQEELVQLTGVALSIESSMDVSELNRSLP